jgi:4-hydroxybenzoate polyprenyltransferase
MNGTPTGEGAAPRAPTGLAAWVRLLRPHQWIKNVLVLVPLFASGQWQSATAWAATAVAFLAFGALASAGYVLNDLKDAEEDARHPTKWRRPIASGAVARAPAGVLGVLLAAGGLALAASVNARLLGTTVVYLASTVLYSSWLKRLFVVDVIWLAGLYTLRIVAGCAALHVLPTVWLLSLSMFTFFSLALAKRYQELKVGVDDDGRMVASRDYRVGDRDVLRTLGLASGGLAALVIALYIETSNARLLYPRPSWLWFVCPVIWYWVIRIWVKCERGELDDDPVIFAFRDRGSWACAALVAACWLAAVEGVPGVLPD